LGNIFFSLGRIFTYYGARDTEKYYL